MKFLEIEYKYDATNIRLTDFERFCQSGAPEKLILVSGWDHFYSGRKQDGTFFRLRVGPDMNQLTFKRKTEEANNFVRTEYNMNLEQNMSKESVSGLLYNLGYDFNVSIFKSCFIYVYSHKIQVYYITYDKQMKELGRFIEIEMREDYAWDSQDEAIKALKSAENGMAEIGIRPQARIKKSLFEMYGIKGPQ